VAESYDIIVRFPSKEIADEFCDQMCDGFGEGLCDFTPWKRKAGTDGTKLSDFSRVKEGDREVWFMNRIFDY
jgi:hypothetical protein